MGVDGRGEETESRDPRTTSAWCRVEVKVKYQAVGVAKVTEHIEAEHVETLEPDVLGDPSLKHMVAIFGEHWGPEREKRGKMKKVKGHGVEEKGVLGGKRMGGNRRRGSR